MERPGAEELVGHGPPGRDHRAHPDHRRAEDFVYPPEAQEELRMAIPNPRLALIDRAGHNPHDEQTAEVMRLIRSFMRQASPVQA